MTGMLNAQEGDYLLWNIERTITKIYIPVLLDSCMNDKGTKDLLTKVLKKVETICEIIKFALCSSTHPCGVFFDVIKTVSWAMLINI